jgi:ATP-dependent DNA helicase RecQ
MPNLSSARDILRSVFGYDDFRPGQPEVISAILEGGPVLAVMPTGSGKSMCYQLPALLDGGLTVVVSPLIALMRDQAHQMRAVGVAAATLNSNNTSEETDAAWRLIRSGELRLLFVSPERLALDGLTTALARRGVKRVAVDEAHCVSEWGHDFRPEYREIRRAIDALGRPQAVAFTATADRATRADIVERLFPSTPQIFVHSFDRPNLDLRFEPKEQPRRQLTDFIAGRKGESGIIYCASRKKTEAIAEYLAGRGHETVAYHAGMDLVTRNRNQDRFLREDGVIAVATVAFGMGINKPDVRFVAHADMPASVEAYYQEIGRAGRDGLPAETLTLYGVEDIALRRRQIEEKSIDEHAAAVERRRLGGAHGIMRGRQMPTPDAARLFRRGSAALRTLRCVPRTGRPLRRHDRRAEGAVGRRPHRPEIRRRLSGQPADGRGDRTDAAERP